MVDQSLVKYVSEQLNAGYSADAIRQTLLSSGYNPQDVEEAISLVYQPKKPLKITMPHIPKAVFLVLAVVILVALIGTGIYLLLGMKGTPDIPPDFTVSFTQSKVSAGSTITFSTDFYNLEKDSLEVVLQWSVVNFDTQDVAAEGTLTQTGSDHNSKEVRVSLPPDTETGKYIIRGTATYKGADRQARATSSSFIIESPEEPVTGPSCFDSIKNQGEDEVDCGGPCQACEVKASCFDGIRNQGEEEIDCGGPCEACVEADPTCYDGKQNQAEEGIDCGGPCSRSCSEVDYGDILAQVKAIAPDDAARAVTECRKLQRESQLDNCIKEVAVYSNESLQCELIKSIVTRDTCVMHFIMNFDDYSLCGKVTNKHIKKSCEQLKEVEELTATPFNYEDLSLEEKRALTEQYVTVEDI